MLSNSNLMFSCGLILWVLKIKFLYYIFRGKLEIYIAVPKNTLQFIAVFFPIILKYTVSSGKAVRAGQYYFQRTVLEVTLLKQ